MNDAFEQPDLELMMRGRPTDLPIRVQIVAPAAAPGRTPAMRKRMSRSLWRRRRMLSAMVLGCAATAGAMALWSPALYTAQASIEVTPANATAIAKRTLGRRMLEPAALKLQIPSLPEYSRSGAAINFLRRLIGLSSVPAIPSEDSFLSALERNVRVSASAQDRVLDLEFRASDPPRAAAYLDLLAGDIAQDQAEARAESARQVRESYSSRLAVARADLQNAEDDLISYARSSGVLSARARAAGEPAASADASSGEADRLSDRLDRARAASVHTERSLRLQSKERDFAYRKSVYEDLLKRERDAESDRLNAGSVRLLAPGRVADRPSRPGVLASGLLGALFGLIAGIPLCLAIDAMDRAVCDPGAASSLLGLPSLGVIPSAVPRTQMRSSRMNGGVIDLNPEPPHDFDAPFFTERSFLKSRRRVETADLGEAFRHVLASIWIAGQSARRPRVLLFASPSRGEGKTTIVANLAIALAHTQRRVLVIEADLRGPRLHHIFDVPGHWGLANLLEEHEPVENYSFDDLAFKTSVPGLYILPAGAGELSIAGMRHIDRLTELLMRCRLEFHAVLIDTPPALAYPDARIVARLSDAAVMVLRAGQSSSDRASALAHQFASDGTAVLGVVLNDCPPGQ